MNANKRTTLARAMTELIQVGKVGTSPEKNLNNPEVIPGMSVPRAWMQGGGGSGDSGGG